MQRRIFAALGIGEEQAQSRFGFLLDAFRFGAPPHGGFALGIDRFVAVLAGEENIREVIAFPKTQSGADPMTGAPKALDPQALAELGIRSGAGTAREHDAECRGRPGGRALRRRRWRNAWPGRRRWRPGCALARSTRWWARTTCCARAPRCAP